MVRAIVGANWGDEGKGKITDMLAKESDIIIRFQGGSNAGHTIINNYGRFALHLLPSGVFYGHTTSIIGNGVALNIPFLVKELESLVSQGVPMPHILVSDRAQILMPYHVLFDTYEEERLGGKSFGSTKSGIAPFYSDKYAKIGFQVSELFEDEAALKDKVQRVCETKNVLLEHLYHKPLLNPDEVLAELMEYKKMVEEDPNLQIIVDQVQYSTYKTPFIPQYQEAKEIFANEIQKCILEDNYTPEQAVSSMEERVAKLFK